MSVQHVVLKVDFSAMKSQLLTLSRIKGERSSASDSVVFCQLCISVNVRAVVSMEASERNVLPSPAEFPLFGSLRFRNLLGL